MRDILLTLLIPSALIFGLFSARGSTLVLLWIGFQRPFDFSWGLWLNAPVWQIAFGIAFLSNFFRKEIKPKHPPFLILYILLILWITATCFTGFLPSRSWIFYTTYIIPLSLGMWLVAATINDLQMLKNCMWVVAASLGINGAKTGIMLALSGGSAISEQISGFIGDNNVFGLTLCLTVAVLMGLRDTLPNKRWIKVLFYAGIFFVILTIIFTKSRGALLSIAVILTTASLLGGKPLRHLTVLAACAAFIYWVVPSEYFGRLETLDNIEEDQSAMGRFENWELAWNAAKDNPILGIGLGNHIPYHLSKGATVHVRVAHSIYFQLLGELSFSGFMIYVLMLLLTVFFLWRDWRMLVRFVVTNPEYTWVRTLSFWLLCGFVGYIFGAAFLNMLLIEFPWYVMLFSSLLHLYLRSLFNVRATGMSGNRLTAKRKGAI